MYVPSPLGRVAPQGPGEVRWMLRLLQHFGEFILRQDLIRLCRAAHVEAPSPKGKALVLVGHQKKPPARDEPGAEL